MRIQLDKRLKEYMEKHGHKDLVLYVKQGQGCCSGALRMVEVRFAKAGDEALMDKGFATAETELGKIYYDQKKILIEKNPHLVFNRILGKVVVQPMGIHVNDERLARVCKIAETQK